jgi:hypothetical protein
VGDGALEEPELREAGDTTRDTTRMSANNVTHLLDQFDHILELLEARVINEIERRGQRFRGGF